MDEISRITPSFSGLIGSSAPSLSSSDGQAFQKRYRTQQDPFVTGLVQVRCISYAYVCVVSVTLRSSERCSITTPRVPRDGQTTRGVLGEFHAFTRRGPVCVVSKHADVCPVIGHKFLYQSRFKVLLNMLRGKARRLVESVTNSGTILSQRCGVGGSSRVVGSFGCCLVTHTQTHTYTHTHTRPVSLFFLQGYLNTPVCFNAAIWHPCTTAVALYHRLPCIQLPQLRRCCPRYVSRTTRASNCSTSNTVDLRCGPLQ